MPDRRDVALVTLGCARNEVDSEELAGRLEAGGFPLVDDAGRRRHRAWSTPAGSSRRRRRTRSTRCSRPPTSRRPRRAPRRWSRSAAWPSATARSSPTSLPEADAVLGFDDYPDIAARLRAIIARGDAPTRTRPRDRRTLLPISPSTAGLGGRRRSRPGHAVGAPDLPAGAPGDRPACRAPPARRRPDGAAEARPRLRPALLVLRDPALPRLVRLAPARRRARRGRWLADAGRPRALPRQRELHVLRQGPRRPAAARDAAARAGRASTASSGCGCPTSSRPRCGRPGRGDRRDAGRRAVLRPVLPARLRRRCCAGCAGSATPSASSACSTQIRAQRPAAGVRTNVIVGFPGETEDDVADAVRLPRRRPGSTRRRLRLLRRGRHRGRGLDDKLDADEIAARRPSTSTAARRGADRPARRGPGRRAGRRARRERSTTACVEGRAAHQGPEVDGSTTPASACRSRPGRRSRRGAVVVRAAGVRPRRARREALRGDARPTQPARPSNWNLPNALTTAAASCWCRSSAGCCCATAATTSLRRLVACGASSPSAIVTDRLDGDIARRRNLVTDFGKIADPIADKALTGMALHRAVDHRRAVVVGDDPRARARVGHHAAAVLGDPVRRDRGQPRRQAQDRAAGGSRSGLSSSAAHLQRAVGDASATSLWWVAAGADGRGGRGHAGDRRRLRARGDAASAGGSGSRADVGLTDARAGRGRRGLPRGPACARRDAGHRRVPHGRPGLRHVGVGARRIGLPTWRARGVRHRRQVVAFSVSTPL